MPLSKLNDEQRNAVTSSFSHNLIIASAGTGKTSTIVARIAYLLQKGVNADKIMLLTFTNKASEEMIARLSQYFSKDITRQIRAGTFHSSAYLLLRKWGLEPILKPASELKALLRSIYEKRVFHHLSELKPYAPSFLYDLNALYQNKVAQSGVSFGEFLTHFNEEHSVFIGIYEDILSEFEEEKRRFNYVDFNDLLLLLKENLAKQDLEFEEILVDEYQDTNALQGSIIEAFKCKSLFCVGDYDQSIYAFNGADIGIIAGFKDKFKNAQIFSLNKNYRSSKAILELANKVILHNERLYPKELVATKEGSFKEPRLLIFDELKEQYAHISELIANSQTPFENTAVIFRNNSSADGIELALRERGIKSVRKDSASFFESLEIKAVCAMFALILNPKDVMAFIYLVSFFKGVGASLAKELFDALLKLGEGSLIKGFLEPKEGVNLAKTARKSYELGLFEDIEILASRPDFKLHSKFKENPILSLSKMNENLALNLEKIYHFLSSARGVQNAHDFLNLVLENELFRQLCDFLARKRATNKAGHLDNERYKEALERIENKLKALKELALKYEDRYKFYNFLTLGASEMSVGKGVQLLSVHSSKGLEFDSVYVIDLAQNRFPNAKLMAMGGSLEEERRLFYVAVTRARNELILSLARYDNNKKQSYKPSQFLVEAGFVKDEG